MLQLLTTAIVHFSSFFRVFIFTSVSLTFLIIKPLEKHFLVYFLFFFFFSQMFFSKIYMGIYCHEWTNSEFFPGI